MPKLKAPVAKQEEIHLESLTQWYFCRGGVEDLTLAEWREELIWWQIVLENSDEETITDEICDGAMLPLAEVGMDVWDFLGNIEADLQCVEDLLEDGFPETMTAAELAARAGIKPHLMEWHKPKKPARKKSA